VSNRKVYLDGRWQWLDEGPAYAGSIRWGGTTVFSGPGAHELNRLSSLRKTAKERAERAAKP
jgi:hypothetical protein